jgi:uncharacterized RDD family membrane protein YckC
LSNNRLDGEDLFPLFATFPALRVLYLIGWGWRTQAFGVQGFGLRV